MLNCFIKPSAVASLLLAFFFCPLLHAQPIVGFSTVVSGLSGAVDIVPEPGSTRLFVVLQGGTIRIVNGTTLDPTPFLTLDPNDVDHDFLTGGERGLLSMAFHPQYVSNGYFFVYYNNDAGDITLTRFQRDAGDPDIADFDTRQVLLEIPKPFANHNGGKLHFGPDDMLYFATGDGGDGNDPFENAQDGSTLLGKMLRLDVDGFATSAPFYDIPADNPFTGASPIRDEIFAMGLRNPWRWSFDRANNDIWIADVGQDNWEEVNHVSLATAMTGLNYGWRCREALHANPSVSCIPNGGGIVTDPIFEYDQNPVTGGSSITGGYVYRGTVPANAPLVGYFVCADYISDNFFMVKADGSFTRQSGLPADITSFGQNNAGELFAVAGGTLYSLFVSGVLPVTLVSFTGESLNGYNELKWTTGFEDDLQKFIVEYATGNDYAVAGEVLASNASNGGTYSFRHNISGTAIKYRLKMVDIDQKFTYSPVITLGRNSKETRIYPTVITNQLLQVIAGFEAERIDIFGTDGTRVYTKALNGTTGYFRVPLPVLQKGMYIVKISGRGNQQTEKIFIQ